MTRKKKEKKGTELNIEIPSGVEFSIENNIVRITGSGGELKREFILDGIKIAKKEGCIALSSKLSRRKEKESIGTIKGHIRNMIKGVTKGILYKMRIVYSHFPMTVKIQENTISINNFLGEKHPRTADILPGVRVEVKGSEVILRGIDKDMVSQSAANIEQATRIVDRDPRVFQDGIYIVEKDGKAIL